MPNVVVIAVTAVLLMVTVETVLSAITAADSQQGVDNGADGGMKSLNIELIKSSILNKLGMQRPPEFGDRLPLQVLASKYNNDRASSKVVPSKNQHKSNLMDATGDFGTEIQGTKTVKTSTDNTISSDNDDYDYHVKTQKLIAFAQTHPTVQILQDQYPLYFAFSEQTQHYRITKAILWVYKRRLDVVIDNSVVIIDVYKINPINLQQSLVSSIKRVLNTTEPVWVPIELQRNMSDWFKTIDEVKNLTLMIQTSYPNKNTTHDKMRYITDARKRDDISEIPYLEVHTHHGYRNRRGAAGSDGRCRRHPVTMDVHGLGWDHFIIGPKLSCLTTARASAVQQCGWIPRDPPAGEKHDPPPNVSAACHARRLGCPYRT
ncbi:unnamed protein product [Macrosiphum euphorbiae]|uniref:TGF-beta propeptide domain-containing protein n=1 Tax=Macrosiphum euphorbiae TaxID=13131 RepID=A0AAV0VVN0_9HEMI|nr:unnamed protein product [Macrosiphum euphorbiae]